MKLLLLFALTINICYCIPAGNVNIESSLIRAILLKMVKDKCYQNSTETQFNRFINLTDNMNECLKTKAVEAPIFVTPLKDFKDNVQGCMNDVVEELEDCLPEESKDWLQFNFDIIYSFIDFLYENKDQLLSPKFRTYIENCMENFQQVEDKTEFAKCFIGQDSTSFEIKILCRGLVDMEKCVTVHLNKKCPTDAFTEKLKVNFFTALKDPCAEYETTENPLDNVFTLLARYTPQNINPELM